jgi:type VI secretion system secreted protein VgrG
VAFMDGDIDRPVVVGGLYNGDYMPPFTLPDQKTKSGIRTRSTLQGGTADYNEFSFEDKKGQELVLLHAQKDHKVEVEHDETITIDGSRQKKVGGSESDNIGGKWTVEVGKTITITTDTDSIHLKAPAGSITLEAATSIELTVGGSSIKMDPASITLKSTMIKVTADAQLELKSAMIKAAADAMLDLKGAMTQVNGDGMLILKGGIVMIN